MANRWTGSWLGGPRSAGLGAPRADADYPGRDLGLAETGPGTVAGNGRRIGGFLLDGLLCDLVAALFLRPGQPGFGVVVSAVFLVEVFVLTALAGRSVGQRLVGVAVVRLDGRPVGWKRAAVRTALLVPMFVPALVQDRDRRGLHDRATGTLVVRT